MTDILQQDIQYMAGVGPNRKKVLSEELGINTLGDLLQYYPYKHIDRSRIYTIHELTGDMPFVQVCGRILSFESFDMGHRKTRVVAHLSDGTGVMTLPGSTMPRMCPNATKRAFHTSFSGDPPYITAGYRWCILTLNLPKTSNSRIWGCNPTTIRQRR